MTLKPLKVPLQCFGLDFDPKSSLCQECEHAIKCQEFMGDRLNRVALSHLEFRLIPDTIEYDRIAKEVDRRDVEAIYQESHLLIFGAETNGSLGKFKEKIFRLAEQARCSIPMFVTTVMFAHAQTYPDQSFSAGILADGRALTRVNTYAEACRAKFASFDITALSQLTKKNLARLDLKQRMLDSEIKVGRWILARKLKESGVPWPTVYQELESDLDPSWLVTEARYEDTLSDLSQRKQSENQSTRHKAALLLGHLKTHKHQAISNFRARESIMPQAIRKVLGELRYLPTDFEADPKPVTDALKFWHRLGQTILHLECVNFVWFGEGAFVLSP